MSKFSAEVTVVPKDGVLDTQGKAVEHTLRSGGHVSVSDVRVGRFITLSIEAEDASEAERIVRSIAADVLSNDLIETFSVKIGAAR